MNTIKTMFESYKKPGKKKLKVLLASILGIGTVSGLGIASYQALKDQNKSFVHQERAVPVQQTVPQSQPTSSSSFYSGLNPFSSHASSRSTLAAKKKKKGKRMARRHGRGKHFAKKHKRHGKRMKLAKFKKGHHRKLAHKKKHKHHKHAQNAVAAK